MKTNFLWLKPNFNAWPLGFAYVLACLESNRIAFDFIDVSCSDNWIRDVKIALENNTYLAVVTGGLIGFYKFFQQLSNVRTKNNPDTPFILGGNVTKDAGYDLLFNTIGIDYGIVGEAEVSLPNLIDAIKNQHNDLTKISGLIYKNIDGDILRNSVKRLDLKNYDILPAWHYFDMENYISRAQLSSFDPNLFFMPILSGRGCIGQCGFCSPSIGGFRERPVKDVVDEMRVISKNYNFDYFIFQNEMFYPSAKGVKEFCSEYMSLEDPKPWAVGLRVDSNIDVETFTKMKEAGCIMVSAGIESGSDKVLKIMNKRTTREQIINFFKNATIAKIPNNGTFILGYQGETEEDLKMTIDLIIDEELTAYASLLYVYPGTAVFKYAVDKGLISNELKHLEKMAGHTTTLFSTNIQEYFVNFSDMPDDQYLNILVREERRHRTYVFKRYPLQNLSCKMEIENIDISMTITGDCHECQSVINRKYAIYKGLVGYIGLLGLGADAYLICAKCHKEISVNIAESSDYRGLSQHFSLLKEKMAKKRRVLVGGCNIDSMLLLRIDILGIDYSKIFGFMDFSGRYKYPYYVNYPAFNSEQAVDLEPDCILLTDSLPKSRARIENMYRKRRLPHPEIVYLCDEKLRNDLDNKIRTMVNSNRITFIKFSIVRRLRNLYVYIRDIGHEHNIALPKFILEWADLYRNKYYSN